MVAWTLALLTLLFALTVPEWRPRSTLYAFNLGKATPPAMHPMRGTNGIDRTSDQKEPATLRLTSNPPTYPGLIMPVDIPADIVTIRVRVQAASRHIVRGTEPWAAGRAILFFVDEYGNELWGTRHQVMLLTGTRRWRSHEAVFERPEEGRTSFFAVEQIGKSGTMKIRNVQIEQVERNHFYNVLRITLQGIWIMAGMVMLSRSRLYKQVGGTSVLILSLLIVIGSTIPNQWINFGWKQMETLGRSITPGIREDIEEEPARTIHEEKVVRQEEFARMAQRTRRKTIFHISGHIVAYFLLGHLVFRYSLLNAHTRKQKRMQLAAALSLAIITEILQLLTTSRSPAIQDALINIASLLPGYLLHTNIAEMTPAFAS